eukprot:2787853-Ditylum_brightwellii.AAC.1
MNDAMVEETIEQQDAPTQIVEQEEMNDPSRPSDHTNPSITQTQQMTPASITQTQQTIPASTEINNSTIIKEKNNTIGVLFQEATEDIEENANNSEDAAVSIHNINDTEEESTGMPETNNQDDKNANDDMQDMQ